MRYSAKTREKLLADIASDGPLRWVPVALVREHPLVGPERTDNQRCLMLGNKLVDDNTEDGYETWGLIHDLVRGGDLEEVEIPAEPYSICEYKTTDGQDA